MRTRDDIFTQVLVRSNRTTTDGFITDTMLKAWFFDAHKWACSYHKWPFTTGRVTTTFATGSGPGSDEWYFEDYKANSIRMMQIGGKRLTKLNFEDYLIFREEEPSGDTRVYSDFGRTVFINPNIDASGSVVAYMQYEPYVDVTDENGLTLFSGFDEEGNEAIVMEMASKLLYRENPTPTFVRGHMISASIGAHDDAVQILDEMWKRVLDENYKYQTSPDSGGQFHRFDILTGRGLSNINDPNQFLF